jgi:hypothetical protein
MSDNDQRQNYEAGNGSGSGNGSNVAQHENEAPIVNDIADLEQLVNSAIILPLARANLLDYLHAYGIPVMNLGMDVANYDNGIDQIASILSRSLYDMRPVKRVMPEEKEKEITETTFNKEQAEQMNINTSCGIWQEEFEEGEPIKILPCNHAFKADAITKWLTTEKAECPICRFGLESKEVVDRSLHADRESRQHDNDDEYEPRDQHEQHAEMPPLVDEQRVRENNIMSRQNDMIQGRGRAYGGGGAGDPARSVYAAAHASRQSIAMPINQLIQNRRYMIENIARASGAVGVSRRWLAGGSAAVPSPVPAEPVRAAPPQAQGSANPPNSINNINNNNEARAEPGERRHNYINYINYINIYNNNNNHDDDNDHDDDHDHDHDYEDDEQANIDEAIRRSLLDL